MSDHFGSRQLKALWIGSQNGISERIGDAIAEVAIAYDKRTPEVVISRSDAPPLAGMDVIFTEVTGEEDMQRVAALAEARGPEQRVVAVTGAGGSVLRQLIRLGIADWLTPDATAEDILLACQPPKLASKSPKGPRNVIAFTPVLGGMGATTLAIESAIMLCKNGKEPTCVVDLDFYAGECADFLNIEAKLAIDSLAKESTSIDQHLLDSVLADHNTGIKLLAAKTNLGASQTINPRAVLQMLNLISSTFTHVVIDLPRAWQKWTDDVVLGCDAVFLVSDGSVPALRSARRQLQEFSNRYVGKVQPRVIVNKHLRSWFSSSLNEKDLETSLGDAFAGTVLDETKLAREAIDRGVPISTLKKNATLLKDLHAIIRKHTK